MASAKTRAALVWASSLLLSALFFASGLGKLANGEASGGMRFDEQFVAWGYPAWFRFPVGAAEAAGAVGLLLPRLRSFAAAGLVTVMLGATVTHLANAEAAAAALPVAVGIVAASIAWAARDRSVEVAPPQGVAA